MLRVRDEDLVRIITRLKDPTNHRFFKLFTPTKWFGDKRVVQARNKERVHVEK
jgi:hypothetical protein